MSLPWKIILNNKIKNYDELNGATAAVGSQLSAEISSVKKINVRKIAEGAVLFVMSSILTYPLDKVSLHSI